MTEQSRGKRTKKNKHWGAGKKSNLGATMKKPGAKQNKKYQGEAGACQVRVLS